jgi:fructokinase
MRKGKIISFGEVLWDLFPDGARFGGAPANFAIHAALQGSEVHILSSVGTDTRGVKARQIMESLGVQVRYLQSNHAATGAVRVTLDAAGKPTYCIEQHAAWDSVYCPPDAEQLLRDAGAFYFGTLGQRSSVSRETLHQLLAIAQRHDVLRVLDVNLRKPFYSDALIRESMKLADVVKLSDEELDIVSAACGIETKLSMETKLRELSNHFAWKLLVCTCGPEGAVFITPDSLHRQPGVPVRVADTVGAGDAFTATLVVGLLNDGTLQEIAENACRVAAAACEHSGAIPQLHAA